MTSLVKKGKRFKDWLDLPRISEFKANEDILEVMSLLSY